MELRVEAATATAEVAAVTEWRKREGDAVTAGEVLVELEFDKAAHDVESPVDGVLREILAHPGDEVEVGGLLAVIEENGA